MPIICPTVTANEPHQYREQIERLEPFAERIHIDLMDGQLTPATSPSLEQVWIPENITTDIHLMYQAPAEALDYLMSLRPNMIIIHAEADGDLAELANELHNDGIKAGLALQRDTPITDLINNFDHILVFGGHLGFQGGMADLTELDKVRQIREQFPDKEIGWDGGVNNQNAKQIADAGVDVLNVGSFIHKAPDPATQYQMLYELTT